MNPLASAPRIRSGLRGSANSASLSTVSCSPSGSASSGMMSLKTMPRFGKSGMSRILEARSSGSSDGINGCIAREKRAGVGRRKRACYACARPRTPPGDALQPHRRPLDAVRRATLSLAGDERAKRAPEEELRELLRERRERLEIFESTLPSLRVPRAQGGCDDLLEEPGLAVRACSKAPEVAGLDAVTREAEASGDDVDVPFGIETCPVLDTRLEQPEILELPGELATRARTRAERLEVDLLLVCTEPAPGGTLAVGRAKRRGQLLPDDAQWEELVALQPQDRLQPVDIVIGEQAVPALRPSRGHQTLILEVPDLGDGDVGEFGLEPPADRPDRQRTGVALVFLALDIRRDRRHLLPREEGQPVLADLHFVPVLELGALDPAAVDVGAVQALLVVDVIAVIALHEHRVAARDSDVVQEDLVLRPSPDAHAVTLEPERLPRPAAARAHHERGTLDAKVGERERVVLGDFLRREGHRRVRARLVVNQQRAALGAVVGRFRILETALGTVDVTHCLRLTRPAVTPSRQGSRRACRRPLRATGSCPRRPRASDATGARPEGCRSCRAGSAARRKPSARPPSDDG